MILDLQNYDGLELRKVASTNGGEYASPCPECGGRDRFRSWPEQDRYWCRRCGKSGDSIQYLRDFHGMSFKEAANQVGIAIPDRLDPARQRKRITRPKPVPPTSTWTDKAGSLVDFAHSELLTNPDRLDWLLTERGLNLETVKRFQLGWLNKDYFPFRKDWGLPDKKVDGKVIRKLLVPSGLVIPYLDMEKVVRVRIRRDRPGKMGKYYVLPGSSSQPMVVNPIKPWPGADPVIIVESELDVILLAQEVGNPFTFIALGSAQIIPDEELAERLNHVPFIFVALDSDEAGGKQAASYWLKTFENAVRTPIPQQFGKDPSEAFLNGLDLNTWISAAYEFVIDLGGNLSSNTLQ